MPSSQRMGDLGAHAANVNKDTESELTAIAAQVAANKGSVIQMMLNSVTVVGS